MIIRIDYLILKRIKIFKQMANSSVYPKQYKVLNNQLNINLIKIKILFSYLIRIITKKRED